MSLLCVFSHAARYSAFNLVEHLWSKLTDLLSDIGFKVTLAGEDKPPYHQKGLSEEEKRIKKAVAFDTALEQLSGYWKNFSLDGH